MKVRFDMNAGVKVSVSRKEARDFDTTLLLPITDSKTEGAVNDL